MIPLQMGPGILRHVRAPGAEMQGLDARFAAAEMLSRVLRDGARLEDAFTQMCAVGRLEKLPARDRALARAIVMMALRRKGFLDDVLKRYVSNPPGGMALEILLVAAAQMLFMRVPHHAAISLAVETAQNDSRSAPFKGLVNAVLRRVSGDADKILSPNPKPGINLPRWLFSRWQRNYGTPIAREIAASHLDEPALNISVKSDVEQWASRLGADWLSGNSLELDNDGRIEDLDGFAEGAWWVQDHAASLPARLLGEVAGKRVLDLCAAPGGKTAQLIGMGAKVTAVDRSADRMDRLEENLSRLGMRAEQLVTDIRTYAPVEPFDAVLLDAPCSATGTLRRHPDVAWHRSDAQIRELAILQRELLQLVPSMVKPGGRVVFSTCSIEPEEGMAHLTALPDGLALDPIAQAELPDGRLWCSPGVMRSLPHYGMDGFFAARFLRS